MNIGRNTFTSKNTGDLGRLARFTQRVLFLCGTLVVVSTAFAVERPFQGRIDGQFVGTPSPDSTLFLSEARAAGQATHVGAFSKVTSDITDLSTGAVEGSFTMTIANGEQVTGAYIGFIVFGATPGSFSWMLDATITGGTGRFSNAAGEFVFQAGGEFVIRDGAVYGDYAETFDGTIDY